jgi:hypothetical protein
VRLLRRCAGGRLAIVDTREVAPPPPAGFGAALEALDQALCQLGERGHRVAGLPCDVVVSDTWMVYDVIDTDLDELPRRAADELVQAALADTAGLKAGELVARWQRQGTRNFACALPAADLQALAAVLVQHRLRPATVNGELVRAFNANRHELAGGCSVLAVARSAGTQLGLIVDGGFAALRYEPGVNQPQPLLQSSHALMRCAGFEPDAVTRYYADETLPAAAATPWRGRMPVGRWQQHVAARNRPARLDVSLSPARARAPRAGWLVAAAGALATTLAALHLQAAHAERRHEARALQTLETALAQTRLPAPAPVDARGARAAAAVVRELQVPWAGLLAAFETVAVRNVALLAVEPSAHRQEVRIMAEAKDSTAMLDYLDALRAQSLRDVVLVSHQVQAQSPGTPIRFQARALWGTP